MSVDVTSIRRNNPKTVEWTPAAIRVGNVLTREQQIAKLEPIVETAAEV
jgi:hypothetical protein